MSKLNINTKFAERYSKYRQKEELQKLKDRFGEQEDEDSISSSDSESDESEVEFNPKLERDFYRTLSLLKKKDPRIYQKDAQFYTEEEGNDEKPSTSKKAVKPMFLKDYERKVILERGGKYDDDDDDSADEEAVRKMQERAASPSYIEEQKELRESFRQFVQGSCSEASDDEGLLKPRNKTQEEKDKEEADYLEWMKGQADLEENDEVQDMKYLRDYWNDPQLNDKETFLRDYILNKGYLDIDETEKIPTYNELMQDDIEDSEEEGESFLQKQEDFERHYNFRFEEPGSHKVKTYPRNIATSVRSKDERRKEKREEVKERKKKEKEQKQQQLKELKNLKRAEIMDKLKKLQELTGNEQLAFSEVDLEGDFDPQHHDQLMQKFFGDNYYNENEEEKPQFDDDDKLEGHWNWDTWTGEGEEGYEEEEYAGEEESYEPNCEDPDFVMDADYDPSQQAVSKKKKKKVKEMRKKKSDDVPLMGKKRKKSHFAEIIEQSKPVFDPQEKTFEQYLDEYYKLDYEDIIDDQPCRFRYRQVVPNDFGLTIDEILGANEKELNQWCSLKKTCMYRSERQELCDVKNYQIKAQNVLKKKRVFASLYTGNDEKLGDSNAMVKVGKKRQACIKNIQPERETIFEKQEEQEVVCGQDTSASSSAEHAATQALKHTAVEKEDDAEFLVPKKKRKVEKNTEVLRTRKPKWPKNNNRRLGGRVLSGGLKVKMGGREFSRQRLRAYGLNPKRLHFREFYSQKRKEREQNEKKEKLKNKGKV